LQNKQINQAEAAVRLGISVRQVKRVLRSYREHDVQGLISKHRGRRANNALAEDVREHYRDFGPTLVWEKLTEKHGLKLSVETANG